MDTFLIYDEFGDFYLVENNIITVDCTGDIEVDPSISVSRLDAIPEDFHALTPEDARSIYERVRDGDRTEETWVKISRSIHRRFKDR